MSLVVATAALAVALIALAIAALSYRRAVEISRDIGGATWEPEAEADGRFDIL